MISRFTVYTIVIGLMVLSAGAASGQKYPSKPIRMVASEPGSGSDFVARLIASELSDSLGQRVIVDNRAPVVMAEIVSKAPADGHTLLYFGSTLWVAPLMQKNVSYDSLRDFAPITLVASARNILVVHPSVPVNSVNELIALAKARPGGLNYASGPTGGSPHLAAELFKAMTGVNFVRINYRSSGAAVTALMSGEVQIMFSSATAVAPHIKSGKVRALAITSAEPSTLFPGLPTVATTVPGYESIQMTGIFAPAKTPAPIINQLHQATVRVLNTADVRERLSSAGTEVVGGSPEQFAAKIRSEIARIGKMIRNL